MSEGGIIDIKATQLPMVEVKCALVQPLQKLFAYELHIIHRVGMVVRAGCS